MINKYKQLAFIVSNIIASKIIMILFVSIRNKNLLPHTVTSEEQEQQKRKKQGKSMHRFCY